MDGCCVLTPAPKLVYRAAKAGQLQKLRTLIDIDPFPELLEWKDSKSRTPLIIAAQNGCKECVGLLLKHGANIHHQSAERDGGGTALHGAVYKRKSVKLIDLLLIFGSNPFVKNVAGHSALDYAINRTGNETFQRRFQKFGYFSGYLEVQVRSHDWQQFWVQTIPRHATPLFDRQGPALSKKMFIFSSRFSLQPDFEVCLEGARARVGTRATTGDKKCTLSLKYNVDNTMRGRLHVCRNGSSSYKLFLRTNQTYGAGLHAFSKIVNQLEFPIVTPARTIPRTPTPSVGVPVETYNLSTPQGVSDSDINEMVDDLCNAFEVESTFNLAAIADLEDMHVNSDSESDDDLIAIPSQLNVDSSDRRNSDVSHTPTCTANVSLDSNATYGSSVNVLDVAFKVDECVGPSEIASEMQSLPDDEICVICLCNKREAGFFHGTSVHRCCCLECAKDLMEKREKGKRKCPICRQEIEHIVESVYL